MSYDVCFLVPRKVFQVDKRFETKLKEWRDRCVERYFNTRAKPSHYPVSVYDEYNMKDFLSNIELDGKVPGQVFDKYKIAYLDSTGAKFTGRSKRRLGNRKLGKNAKVLSELDTLILEELMDITRKSYPYGKVGIWLFYLWGSRKILPVSVKQEPTSIEDIRQHGIVPNQITFLSLASELTRNSQQRT